MNRRSLLFVAACATLVPLAASSAHADFPAIDVDGAGLALRGYDTVSYFTEGRPRRGLDAHSTRWNGATWRFASAANLARFRAAPQTYAPQFGGYCAWAVSRNYLAPGDPLQWRIVDGQLFLNFNAQAKALWEADRAASIVRGRANWPRVLTAQRGAARR